jgi:hypothetical protein
MTSEQRNRLIEIQQRVCNTFCSHTPTWIQDVTKVQYAKLCSDLQELMFMSDKEITLPVSGERLKYGPTL